MRKLALLVSLVVVFGWSSGASAVPITSGLVAGYDFNGNANDVSGNGNNGVVNGATLTTDRFGHANAAYSFDGVDDYIDLGNQNLGSAVSVSLWVNFVQNTASPQMIFNKYDGDSGAGDLTIDRTFDLFYGGAGGLHKFSMTVSEDGLNYSDSRSTSNASAGDWMHLVGIFDSGIARIYVNGTNETSWNTGYSTLHPSAVHLLLGAETKDHPTVNEFNRLHGSMDDVYIYDRALSASEVSTLYSAIPEPNTALLLGVGLTGLSIRRRRVL